MTGRSSPRPPCRCWSATARQALAARVLKAEHQLYPLALGLVAEGKVMMKDGRAVFEGETLLENGGTTLISPASWAGPSDLQDLARITP